MPDQDIDLSPDTTLPEDGQLTPPCDYEGLAEAIIEKGDAFDAEVDKAIAIFKALREALLPYRLRCSIEMRKVMDAIGNLPEKE